MQDYIEELLEIADVLADEDGSGADDYCEV
jgi:hypothetical protein